MSRGLYSPKSINYNVFTGPIIGSLFPISIYLPDLRAAGSFVYGAPCPVNGEIISVYTRLTLALATGDAILTGSINGIEITNGVITITQAGSAPGNIDFCNPTNLNVVEPGDNISWAVTGADTAAVSATMVMVIRITS